MWLEIVKTIGDYIGDIIKSNKEKNLKISELMMDIHNLLNDVVIKLENDEYPHESCGAMRVLTDNLHQKIKPSLKEKADYICNLLANASGLEREFSLRNSTDIINELKSAAGEFKAFSLLLKS